MRIGDKTRALIEGITGKKLPPNSAGTLDLSRIEKPAFKAVLDSLSEDRKQWVINWAFAENERQRTLKS